MKRRDAGSRTTGDAHQQFSIDGRLTRPEFPVPGISGRPPQRAGSGLGRLARRLLPLGVAAALAAVAIFWPGRSSELEIPLDTSPWEFELAAEGSRPGLALAFSREAGLHIVHVPASGDPLAERATLPARLLESDVYLMSLGWSPLDVRTSAPADAQPMAFGATGRFIKVYHTAERTGVRTSWR